jgi:hypothetical protein
LAAALGSAASNPKPDMNGAIKLAAEQLEQHGTEGRILILTTGGNVAQSLAPPSPALDMHSFLIGDLDPDYKNRIKKVSRSYELNSLDTLQKAVARYLKDSGGFKDYGVNLNEKGGFIDFTHVNFFYGHDKILLLLQYRNTIPVDALDCQLTVNKQVFHLTNQENAAELNKESTAAFLPLGERGSLVIIRKPPLGRYAVSVTNTNTSVKGLFLPVIALWSGDVRLVLVAVIAGLAAAVIAGLIYHLRVPYKTVFRIGLPSIAPKVVCVARKKRGIKLGPGDTLRTAAEQIAPPPATEKDRYKSLEPYAIKFENGRWQISNLPGPFINIVEGLKKNNGTIQTDQFIIAGRKCAVVIRKK